MLNGFMKSKSLRHINKMEGRLRSHFLTNNYEFRALHSEEVGVNLGNEDGMVVSLTTIPERIHNIHIAIESIFQQSEKAKKVVLWLPEDRFNSSDISALLRKQEARGLEIMFCPQDIGPYTKYYYCMQKYPGDLIVTVDDDRIYPIDMLDQLIRAFRETPNRIYCHRAHRITLNTNNELLPYKKWQWSIKDSDADLRVFPTGVGGVLYFPGCFDDDVLNKPQFLKLAPMADDIWLKAMSLKKGTLCQHVPDARDWNSRCVQVSDTQMVKLKSSNKAATGGNDSKIKAVFEAYELTKFLAE